MKRIASRIAALQSSEHEYTRLAAEADAEAVAAPTEVGYERASSRANELARIALRLAGERRALEARLNQQALPTAA